jgi:alkylated DNA repair dioxygenase AlkB
MTSALGLLTGQIYVGEAAGTTAADAEKAQCSKDLGGPRDHFGKLSHRYTGLSCAPAGDNASGRRKGVSVAVDLFAPSAGLERIRMPDADVFYLDKLALAAPDTEILQRLMVDIPWRSEAVRMGGRRVLQPRLTAWFGDAGASYAYSGLQLAPLPWTPLLRDIKNRIEKAAGSPFNSVLLNYYRDQSDSIGFHSDNEPELGERPVIASLSLGEERLFVLKHKRSKTVKPVHLRLVSGSLLLMQGDTQRCWRHGILKESRACGPRVNLTFRRIVQPGGRR